MRNVNLHRAGAIVLAFALTGAISAEMDKTPINNDDVWVHWALEKPHVKGKAHKHDLNRVMIYLQGGTQVFEEDGKKTTLKYKAGDVLWSPKTGMHSPELLTEEPVNIVEVEIKKPGSGKVPTGPLDPLKVDKKHYKLQFENDQVRVWRVKFGPHEKAPLHQHMLNRVTVYLTDQNVRITPAEGPAVTSVHKAGEAAWSAPAKHSEENLSDTVFEAITVEPK